MPAEHAVANPRDEIVHKITETARDEVQNIGERSPGATQSQHDVERGIRAREQRSIACEDHERIRQGGPLLG